jgi:hypothetical protein
MVGDTSNISAMFMKMVWSTEALLVAGWTEWCLPEEGKQSFMNCLTPEVLSQLLTVRCFDVLMFSFAGLYTSHSCQLVR